MMRRFTATTSALLACALAMSLAACGSSTTPTAGASETTSGGEPAADSVAVVASTNVYGSIAEAIGGEQVSVTSIITNAQQDPHSYEASTHNQLALSKAALVIENGGGYDDFVSTMLKANSRDDVIVLNAVDISGIAPNADGELNEHVWYSLAAMSTLATKIADELGTIDPAHAEQFTANANDFNQQIQQLELQVAQIKSAHDGAQIAITEPVPLYVLEAAGLKNMTPEKFSEAIEEDTDVSPLALKETLDVIEAGSIAALVYNAQTTSPATQEVLEAAKKNQIPVVPVTETLPDSEDYLSWMAATINELASALDAKGSDSE